MNNKLFDENGFAIKDCRVKVYNYDFENNEYYSSTLEHVVKGSGIPANSTFVKPLEYKDGFTQIFNEDKQEWEYIEDHRYDDVYDINTKQKADVKYLGKLKPDHTLIAPPSADHEFIDGEWIITEEKQAELDALEKQRKIQSLHDDLENIERQITRLERIKQRTELEEQELDQLIDQSTDLYRAIKEAEGETA